MLNLTLTEENGAAAAARRGLREGNGMLPPAIRDDVLLLVSELVTNAVRHAGAGPERPVQVQLLHGPCCVVVAVTDEGPRLHAEPKPVDRERIGRLGPVPRRSDRRPLGRRVHEVRQPSLVQDRVRGNDRRCTHAASATLARYRRPPRDLGPLGSPWPQNDRDRPSPRPASRSPGCSAWLLAYDRSSWPTTGRPRRAPRLQLGCSTCACRGRNGRRREFVGGERELHAGDAPSWRGFLRRGKGWATERCWGPSHPPQNASLRFPPSLSLTRCG